MNPIAKLVIFERCFQLQRSRADVTILLYQFLIVYDLSYRRPAKVKTSLCERLSHLCNPNRTVTPSMVVDTGFLHTG